MLNFDRTKVYKTHTKYPGECHILRYMGTGIQEQDSTGWSSKGDTLYLFQVLSNGMTWKEGEIMSLPAWKANNVELANIKPEYEHLYKVAP